MSNDFKLCPECGSKNIQNVKNRKWFCPDCGFDLYNNVAAAVGIIITDKENNILVEVRAKEPRKGYLALPGGFVDPDETAEEAVLRECREEIGAEIKNIKYLCTFPNTYVYKNITYKTCDMFFIAEIPENYKNIEDMISQLKTQESEVAGLKSVKIETETDVDSTPMAFESSIKTLKYFIKKE